MQKIYERINWENDPSTNTPINEDNLNKMDYSIDKIDDRVVALYGYQERVSQSEANAKTYASNAKTSETNAKTSETNAKASELLAKQYRDEAFATTPDGYKEVVEKVELMDIQTSTSNDLYNTKEGGLRLIEMGGNTQQNTLRGVNKFGVNDYSTLTNNGISFSLVNNIVTVEGTKIDDTITNTDFEVSLLQNIEFEVGKTYTFKLHLLSGTLTGNGIGIYFRDKDTGRYPIFELNCYGDIAYSITPSTSSIAHDILFRFRNTSYNCSFALQIEEGDTATDYEEFCGNTPSPNPNYPQSINNTGDCVEMIQGSYYYASGAYTSNSNAVCTKNTIPCKEGDVIKISTEYNYNQSIVYFNNGKYVSYASPNTTVNTKDYTVPTGVTHFKFTLEYSTPITPSTVGKIQLTVNGKYVTQFKEYGKNLCSLGSKNVNEYKRYENDIFIPPGTYTISAIIQSTYTSSSGAMLTFYSLDENGNVDNTNVVFKEFGKRTSKTVTLTKTYKSIRLCSANGTTASAGHTSVWTDIQIEEGTTATTYEPYTEHISTIYTDEPLRSGDVVFKDDDSRLWQVERRISLKKWDSSEFVIISAPDAYDSVTYYGLPKPTNANFYNTVTIHISGRYSNKFIPKWIENVKDYDSSTVFNNANAVGKMLSEFDSAYIACGFPTGTTLEEAQSIGDIELEYKLKTPTYEILDTASQIALNALETFNGVTYIEIDSRVQPESVEWEYGTSQVTARMIKNELRHDTQDIKIAELTTALLALGSEV